MAASVLSGWHDPNDPAGLADAVGRAAATDWRAAAWMLKHHPLSREDFGDLGRDERVRRELLAGGQRFESAWLHPQIPITV
jgi:hypothetical protein